MLLIRYLLIGLIVYLIVRSFVIYGNEEKTSGTVKDPDKGKNLTNKKVSKKIGEYIDYEDVGGKD
jgi:hypothetical protein